MAAAWLSVLGYSRKYAREQRTTMKRMVTEIYSPPRITAEIKRGRWRSVAPGLAFDLTVTDPDGRQALDFRRADKRAKARAIIREQRSILLIASLECTAYSVWQRINDAKAANP